MSGLGDFLREAPRARVSEWYRGRLGAQGLVQRQAQLEDLQRWGLDPARIEEVCALPQGDSIVLMAQIAAFASGRGLLADSWEAWGGRLGAKVTVERSLTVLEERFLVHRALDVNGGLRITAFAEFAESLRRDPPVWARAPLVAPIHPGTGAFRFGQALSTVSAHLRRNPMRTTRNGLPHRRDLALLLTSLEFPDLPPQAAAVRLDLAFEWLATHGLLGLRKGRIEVVDDPGSCLPPNPGVAVTWWKSRRGRDAGQLSISCPQGLSADAACLLAAPASTTWHPPAPHETPEFDRLPRLLAEALAVGALEAGFTHGRLRSVMSAVTPDEPSASWWTPDLRLLLGPHASPADWYHAELAGVRESTDVATSFRFTRESVEGGIDGPKSASRWREWVEAGSPPQPVAEALLEWAAARTALGLRHAVLLRVREPRRREELEALPEMRVEGVEILPGWGFALNPSCVENVKTLLHRLGQNPVEEDAAFEPLAPPPPGLCNPSDLITTDPWPTPMIGPAATVETPLRRGWGTKYGGAMVELNADELIRLLEFAMTVDAQVEVELRGSGSTAAQMLRPMRLDRRREPMILVAEASRGHERELGLDRIRRIRLIETN